MKTTTAKCLWISMGALCLASATWAQTYPTVALRELPDALKLQWRQAQPDMNSNSRCAAAFDNHTDHERMAFKCSIYIKLGAEGARRAMRYCEEERVTRRIHAPCRIVQE